MNGARHRFEPGAEEPHDADRDDAEAERVQAQRPEDVQHAEREGRQGDEPDARPHDTAPERAEEQRNGLAPGLVQGARGDRRPGEDKAEAGDASERRLRARQRCDPADHGAEHRAEDRRAHRAADQAAA